jgi:Excreted virulence factor EspC, type VII ESX diderm
MADSIRVVPAHLREAAAHHQETSDYLRTVPASHAAIQESLDSLGPVFSELREAGRDLLELRRQCYEQQADDHADLADKLTVSAAMWEEHEQEAARDLRGVVDGGR